MGVPEHNQSIIDGEAALTLDGGSIDVEDRAGRVLGKTRVMDSSETLVDPATEATVSSELPREIATWSAGAIDVSGSDGSSVSASTTATGSGEAAAVSIPDGRTTCTAAWDVSGAATVTVEVSPDGGATWYQEHSASPGSAETGTHTITTGFDDVRVYVDTALNSASIGAKGV